MNEVLSVDYCLQPTFPMLVSKDLAAYSDGYSPKTIDLLNELMVLARLSRAVNYYSLVTVYQRLEELYQTVRSGQSSEINNLTNGLITLDPVTHEAQLRQGEDDSAKTVPVPLTAREYSLLEALLIRPGAVLSREVLEDKLYGYGDEVESNAVEFIIYNLRRKLGASAIKNVRGVGWKVAKEG